MANSVELIDPMKSVTNLPNGTPEYEKMFMFAELLGERRARSVITLNTNQGNTTLKTELSNTNVNMMGVDYTENQKNSAKFTTNWTDNETNTDVILEGFGISRIDVKIDSSYIPRVTIEFIDIRGLVFLNKGENSPYSLLFDFPPPIFKMTLKGYYGKSLDYDLHLVKHHERFDSNDGNYYISVEFIARTFAPLADVPFKFTELVGIMGTETQEQIDPNAQESGSQDINNPTDKDELNFNPKVAPRNTYELVEKLKRLTDELKDIKNTSEESQIFDDARDGVLQGNRVIEFMNNFNTYVDVIYQNNAFIFLNDNTTNPNTVTKDNGGDFRILNSVNAYNDIIKKSNDSGNNSSTESRKLYIGILYEKIRNGNALPDGTPISAQLTETLNDFKTRLITRGKGFSERNIKDGFIGDPKTVINYTPSDVTRADANLSSNNYDKYYALDVTKFYIELENVLKTKRDVVDQAQADLVSLVNENLKNILGFKPSIYNIFKVLCDDLDRFFKELGKVSNNGEIHHNKYFNQIIGQIQEDKSKRVTKHIYPFPLYIESDITCNTVRKVRRIPPDNLVDNERFPEVVFIDKFIETMISLKKKEDVREMRTQIDVNGNNKWIPVTPADSILHGGVGYESPYANIETTAGDTNAITSFYTRLVNRFYIASQYTYGRSFYSTDKKSGFLFWGDKTLKRNDLIKFVARSEAINVANSIINDQILGSLKEKSKVFPNNLPRFYTELQKLPIWNTVGPNAVTLTDETTFLYRNRNDPNYVGVEIVDEPPSIRTNDSEDIGNPINQLLDKTNNWYDSIANLFTSTDDTPINEFTTENIPFFSDYSDNSSDVYTTKYINGMDLDNSNLGDYGVKNFRNVSGLYSDGNVAKTIASILTLHLDEVEDFIMDGTTYSIEAQGFVLSSLFGRARSYFSEYGERDGGIVNSYIGNVNSRFLNPAVVEVPRFSTYYMGALLEYNSNTDLQNEIDTLLDTDWFEEVSLDGTYFKDDANKVSKLGLNDKGVFIGAYDTWLNPLSNTNNSAFVNFRNDLRNLIGDSQAFIDDDENDRYDKILSLIKEGNYRSIEKDIVVKTTILNYSEYTFNNETNTETTYVPLSVTSGDTDGGEESRSAANDIFFSTFWNTLKSELPERENELNEIDSDFRSVVQDEDIKTQLYYSFKNISDRWISGINTSKKGFPLNNDENDSLISKFAFVDRAMNPIGDDVIINAESLIEMSKDYDINMFQVFSRLLSLNGFEFFPLQNFMTFNSDDGKWGDAFKIFTTLEQQQTPAFVCMYIGGASSTLENSSSTFDNDGILDLEGEGIPDFSNIGDCEDSQEVKDSAQRSVGGNESRFKYSEPKAFRVRFGEQNQSFFTDIQIEGRDFPATSDSLAILSKIAGDGKTTAPIPKGQNLFSVYENRAYEVTVTMLGNVMIQPTQYFQLENIPLYAGAYLIIEVNHHVTANHMTTTFKGVKILKFPNPFVKSFATVVGIDSGTAEDLTGSRSSEIIGDTVSARTLPDQNSGLYNNEMFSLNISP